MQFEPQKYLPSCEYLHTPLLALLSDAQQISYYIKNGKVHFSTRSLLYYGGDTNFHEPVSAKFMDLVAEHSSCHMILGELYKDPSSLANIIKKSAEFVSHIAGALSRTLSTLVTGASGLSKK